MIASFYIKGKSGKPLKITQSKGQYFVNGQTIDEQRFNLALDLAKRNNFKC